MSLNALVLPGTFSFTEREEISSDFQKGQYSFVSKQFVLGSEQHPTSLSGAAPEHADASAALGAFGGTTQPCLEKINPAQEASCAKYMVIFRKQVNSYKAP